MPGSSRDLPIWKLHEALQHAWTAGNRFVLISPTGSGKTTQVCQMLLDSGRAGDKQIVVLQPRRVATRVVAARVALERGTKIGEEVGYQIRFEDQISGRTRIRFMTEGVLLRLFAEDPQISRIHAILFDEFHERNLFSDVGLGLALQLQQKSRPDLLLGVMSATLDAEPIADFLGGCPILQSEGRSHPVDIHHLDTPDTRTAPELAAERVAEIADRYMDGNILVFMPGMAEIQQTIREIQSRRIGAPLQLIPLHGDLPPDQQDLAFAPSKQRKVIVSTNVAETSVTLEGVKFVVDGGFARISRYDASTGIATLRLEPISRASAQQRAGRAGRTSPGICWRLWTIASHKDRPEQNTPEIHRTDLSSMVLLMHSLGIQEVERFPLPDPPSPNAVRAAEDMLERLGALRTEEKPQSVPGKEPEDPERSERFSVTSIGREMLRLPLHPRYARMLIEAKKLGCVRGAALFAALTSGRDLLLRTRDKEVNESRELFETNERSDFFTLANAFRYAQKSCFDLNVCRKMGVHAQTARLVEQTWSQLLDVCARHHFDISEKPVSSDEPMLKCILAGFADHLAIRQDAGTLECHLVGGRLGTLVRESVVQKSKLFVAAEIRTIESRDRPLTLLSLASAVELAWLKEMFPHQLEEQEEAIYDPRHRRVECIRTMRFRDLLLGGESVENADPEKIARALAEEVVDEPMSLPHWNHDVKQWIGRVRLSSHAAPDYDLPTYSREECVRCLARAFYGLRLFKEAKEKPLLAAFKALLNRDQQEFVEMLAPASLPLLSKAVLKLLYSEDGSVSGNLKLQDALKLTKHPVVGDGKIPVVLHLQAPNQKKLESTADMAAWRRSHYPKHRSFLVKQFPSVSWP